MATVSFHLKEPKAERPTAIFALLTIDRRTRIKVYTGRSIHPRQWLAGEQKAQERGYPDNPSLNTALSTQGKQIEECYAAYLAQGLVPTAAQLKEAAAPKLQPEAAAPPAAGLQFWDYFAEWVELARLRGKARSASVYDTTGRHLRGFEKKAKYAVGFDTITPAFNDRFTAYLLTTAGLTDNTVAKQVMTLKRFMKWAAERGYHSSIGYERLTWKRQEPDIITLTAEEVEALENLDLPEAGYLDNARGLFLLSCYTGLRYSDLVSIRPEHLRGQTLRLTTQKTRETVTIPLQARALPIVGRMIAGEIRAVSNQKLNDYLKELGERAGITDPVEVIRYRGGNRESTTLPKWQKLGCHTGRRTFVTLSLERGLRPELVMKITGHRDWKSFKRYVNITEQTVEREFARVYEMPTNLKLAV
ncbi:site-specific integrase [Hymenobacter sediminicola]|uniref:Site-specific integrase n=1 Tax=Hymenobacter sediminicola TaxID=2761579 RepID=A0A7G7W3Q1_9BACT|nr:site-specific integrase [Hymenobacter sediminicola]QNH60994.1 site-specific integrase [Hymenobacter sediminicola]